METINITKQNAKNAYNEANSETKKVLQKLFGTEIISENITDRIKTIDDFLDKSKLDDFEKNLVEYKGTNRKIIGARALFLLEMLSEALNEGWVANWDDSNENKHYPYFEYSPGVGFSYGDYRYGYSITFVGSRLCYKTVELAEYAGKQFKDLYNDFLTK